MKDKFLSLLKRFGKAFWGSLSHNLGLKLLSLLLAILLWSYVVSSNPSITRTKDINGLTAYLGNESTLNANRLALASDPSQALDGISVRLEVPQASYALADAENVQVTVDLSSVRAAGTQEVALRATTSYGRVVSIVPESVKLEFETYDSRSVPVNAAISGEQREDTWYNINRLNPEELVISGPSSVVQTVASAYVYVDVTGRENSYITAARFVLFDYAGEELPQTLLSSSSSSVTVGRGAQVFYSIMMPGSRVEDGAVVKYAIIGENTVVRAGARVGADPDGSENWNVATCGPGIEIGAGATVKAGAMIYDSVPAGEGGEE